MESPEHGKSRCLDETSQTSLVKRKTSVCFSFGYLRTSIENRGRHSVFSQDVLEMVNTREDTLSSVISYHNMAYLGLLCISPTTELA